jgi:uncharacterized protein (TIGR03435 family)
MNPVDQGYRRTPGRIWIQMRLDSLIARAYSLPEWRVSCQSCSHRPSAAEPWIAFYDVLATYPVDTGSEQIHLMLQQLLADRSKLAAH